MQKTVPNYPPPTSLNQLKDVVGVSSVDYSAEFDGLYKRLNSVETLLEKKKAPGELIRYLPGLAKLLSQGQLKGTLPKKAYADDTYKDLKTAEFTIQLSANQYMNFHSIHLVFPLKIKKNSNVANHILSTEIIINNFFAHWIKEINIKCLGDDIPILPTTNTIDIYKYSDAMVKHLPKKVLKVIENDLLYSKKMLPDREDRRDERTNDANTDNRADDNIDERIQKFQNQLQNVYWYRIPSKYICDLGLVNTPIKFNTKWCLTFEINMQKLFESKTNQAADGLPNAVEAKIIIDLMLYFPYYQFNLDDVYRTYFELAMVSENLLRTSIRKTPLQKSYELVRGAQSKTIMFNNAFN